jgi:5'(3')-deoxyribonucleotidase
MYKRNEFIQKKMSIRSMIIFLIGTFIAVKLVTNVEKSKLFIDMDDVLCHYTRTFLLWHNLHFQTHYNLSSVSQFQLSLLLNITQEEMGKRLDDFSKSDNYLHIPMMNDADSFLEIASKRYEIHIVTSRSITTSTKTHNWLKMNHLDPFISSITYSFKKSNMCRNDSITKMAIDDAPHNIEDYSRNCPHLKKIYLFNFQSQHPWANMSHVQHLNDARIEYSSSFLQINL